MEAAKNEYASASNVAVEVANARIVQQKENDEKSLVESEEKMQNKVVEEVKKETDPEVE